MLLQAFALSSLAVGTLAVPTSRNVKHESRPSHQGHRLLPRGSPVDANGILPIRIALKQSNLDNAYDYLMDVADPTSPNYSQHWTEEQVQEKFAPSDDSVKAVQDWLVSSGISSDRILHYDSKGWLGVQMTTEEAERIFGTKYFEYTDSNGAVRIGSDEYELPEQISQLVDYVNPGVQLSPPLQKKSVFKRDSKYVKPMPDGMAASAKSSAPANCDQVLFPECIKALYNIPKPSTGSNLDAVGVYEQGNDIYSQADLDGFSDFFATGTPKGTGPIVKSIDGNPTTVANGAEPGFESDGDIELLTLLTYPHNVTLYQTAPDESGQFLTNWLDALDGSFCHIKDRINGAQCGTYKPEKVISVSWSGQEHSESQFYQIRACNEFLKLGLQGHTLVFSSGDHGVGGRDGCMGDNSTIFNPPFPSNCPYVLSVGATQIDHGKTSDDPESSMNQPNIGFSSGGGFSNYFFTAPYQVQAVEKYFRSHDPGYPSYNSIGISNFIGQNGGIFARHGRGYPDVSANGANVALFWNGEAVLGTGTSFSTPIWASIITLINQERENIGKRPVGFVNPALYRNTQAFHDIVQGDGNPNCGTNGFSAVEGWDPVTGLGTPDYPALKAAMLALP